MPILPSDVAYILAAGQNITRLEVKSDEFARVVHVIIGTSRGEVKITPHDDPDRPLEVERL